MSLFSRRKKSAPAPLEMPPEPTLLTLPPVNAAGQRSWQDHRDWILQQITPLPEFGMHIVDSVGLTLCEDIVADLSLPGFDNSAMDGYAVQAADLVGASQDSPVVLAVVGEIPAGIPAELPLAPGTAMKIMTGAPTPRGADTVVNYELTDRGAEDVRVFAPLRLGSNIRHKGSDINEGEQILNRGTIIDARTVGLLAGVGLDKVMVRPRARVVVVATGSELVEPGEPLTGFGQLYDSNSYMLAAAAEAAGAQVFRVGAVGDDEDALIETISDQMVRADLIITSGGISEGDWDLVKKIAPKLGKTNFAKLAMQPGKPQGFGLMGEDDLPWLMLPGNPVSAFVSFEAFVRPVLRKLMGAEQLVRPTVLAKVTAPIPSKRGRAQFARAHVRQEPDGRTTAEPIGGPSSHLLGSLQRSNALVLIDEDTEMVETGQQVAVWMLADD